jgi:hypothetical protein
VTGAVLCVVCLQHAGNILRMMRQTGCCRLGVKTACKEKGRCEKEKTFAAHETSGDEDLRRGLLAR